MEIIPILSEGESSAEFFQKRMSVHSFHSTAISTQLSALSSVQWCRNDMYSISVGVEHRRLSRRIFIALIVQVDLSDACYVLHLTLKCSSQSEWVVFHLMSDKNDAYRAVACLSLSRTEACPLQRHHRRSSSTLAVPTQWLTLSRRMRVSVGDRKRLVRISRTYVVQIENEIIHLK